MLNLMGAIPVLLKQQSKYCKYCKSEYVPVRQGTWYSSLSREKGRNCPPLWDLHPSTHPWTGGRTDALPTSKAPQYICMGLAVRSAARVEGVSGG